MLYVLASNQINERTLRFINELGLRARVRFLSDEGSAVIDQLELRRENPEPIEAGVPHPATYLLDREGVIRHAEYVPEVADHPNYDSALQCARQLAG